MHAPKRALARRMRSAPTANEQRLWTLLRDRRLDRLKFRRQVPIGRYVVDFLCLRYRLIVECDGPFHEPTADALRDAWLAQAGFRVLRFSNTEVFGRPENVLGTILRAVATPDRLTPQLPPDDAWRA